MNNTSQPDELVERVAYWLLNKGHARGQWLGEAHELLTIIKQPLSDGSRVVRTDPDQSLPVWDIFADTDVHNAVMDYRKKMIDSGFRKILPLLEERKE